MEARKGVGRNTVGTYGTEAGRVTLVSRWLFLGFSCNHSDGMVQECRFQGCWVCAGGRLMGSGWPGIQLGAGCREAPAVDWEQAERGKEHR